jgi:hypothetical protein
MMTAEELMGQYKKVREGEGVNGGLGLITNPQALERGILLVGMNPSGQGDGVHIYCECKKDDFWGPKFDMMGDYNDKCGYIDLLPIRNGRQEVVHSDKEINYFGKLLAHTRDYIEELRPRLIIFANSKAHYYWGFKKETPWMGYTFQKVNSPLEGERKYWKLYQITGIVPTGVNRYANSTNLIGTYFLQYRQHKDRNGIPVSEERKLRFVDIQTIAKFIDVDWEKKLY